MDDLENEVSGHQAQLQTGLLGDTLETRKHAQDNGEEHHEDGEEHGREDTGDDSCNWAG